jgi:hypothetical protein
MSKLDELLVELSDRNETESIFSFRKNLAFVEQLLDEVCFIAEIDKLDVYILQVIRIKGGHDDRIIVLSQDEANELYLTRTLSGYDRFEIYDGLVYKFNLEKNYVKVFSSDIIDIQKSPRDNYGEAFERFSSPYVDVHDDPDRVFEFYTTKLELCVEMNNLPDTIPMMLPNPETWGKLKELFEFRKHDKVKDLSINKKIFTDMSVYFADVSGKNVRDDEYAETLKPEIIKIPKSHKLEQIDQDTIRVIHGPTYDRIEYIKDEGTANRWKQGYIRKFNSVNELKNYLWSVMDWINHEYDYNFDKLWRYYYSYKWPLDYGQGMQDLTKEPYNLYEMSYNNRPDSVHLGKALFKICKFKDKPIVECEVWEHGVVYMISNYFKGRVNQDTWKESI